MTDNDLYDDFGQSIRSALALRSASSAQPVEDVTLQHGAPRSRRFALVGALVAVAIVGVAIAGAALSQGRGTRSVVSPAARVGVTTTSDIPTQRPAPDASSPSTVPLRDGMSVSVEGNDK